MTTHRRLRSGIASFLICLLTLAASASPEVIKASERALAQQDYVLMQRLLTKEFGEEPKDGYAAFLLAFAKMSQTNRFDLEMAQGLVSRFPQDGSAHLLVGFTTLDSNPEVAIPEIQKAVELGLPSSFTSHIAANILLDKGKLASALDAYTQSSKYQDEFFSNRELLTDVAKLTSAMDSTQSDHLSDALRLLATTARSGLGLEGGNQEAALFRALQLLAEGEPEFQSQALELLKARTNWQQPFYPAQLYFRLGAIPEALASVQQARTQKSLGVLSPRADLIEGSCYIALDRLDEAESLLRPFLEDEESLIWRAAALRLARAYVDAGRPADAQPLIDSGLNQHADDVGFRLAKVKLLVQQKQLQEAKALYAQLENNPVAAKAAQQDPQLAPLFP